MSQLKNSQSLLKDGQVERVNSPLLSLFCFIQASNALTKAHSYWGGQPTVLSLLLKMWISSRNTLTGTSRISLSNYLGAPWPSQVDTKINHHEGFLPGLQTSAFLLCPHMGEREWARRVGGECSLVFIRSLTLLDQGSTLTTSFILNYTLTPSSHTSV